MHPNVELRELRTFLAVAEELHFARAAGQLGITPSRASQTIATLETRLGIRLFERTSRRVTLTPAGEQLRAEISPHLAGLDEILVRARHTAGLVSGRLRLATMIRLQAGPHIAEIIETFEQRHPGARASLDHDNSYLENLRRGRWDLIIARLPLTDPDVTVGPVLTRERRILLVARNHPLAQRQLVTLDDVVDAGLPLPSQAELPDEMMDDFIPPVAPSGRPVPRVEVTNVDTSLVGVAAGHAGHVTVASFFDYITNPKIVGVPLDLGPSQTALAWITARTTPMIKAFARVAADITARHGLATPPSAAR
jgi:DNA-binding transcriptional LysR family regulator